MRVPIIGRVWALVDVDLRRSLRIAVAAKGLQAALAATPIVLIGPLLADLADGDADWMRWAVVFGLVLVAEVVVAIGANRVLFTRSYDVGASLRHRLVDHVERVPLPALATAERQGLDPVTVATRDVDEVEGFVNMPLAVFVGPAGVAAVLLVGTVVLVPASAPAVAAVVVAAVWLGRRSVAWFTHLAERRRELRGEVDRRVSEHVRGIAVTRAFGGVAAEHDRLATGLAAVRDANLEATRRVIPVSALRSTITAVGPLAVLAIGALRLDDGLDPLTLVTAVLVAVAGFLALGEVLARVGGLPGVTASLDRIEQVLALPTAEASAVARPTTVEIAFEAVDAGYVPGVDVLHDVGFRAREGEVTALVGPSGAGKSACLGLLAGVLAPSAGSVAVGPIGVGPDVLGRGTLMGIVTQEVRLLQDDLWTNVTFGRRDLRREDVEDAARRARLLEVVERLDQGWETPVGVDGAALSGGERQRVAIARTLLHDAPVLLLDEATSALDATTERLFTEALAELVADRTVLVVAHRLSTLRTADHVVVLEAGRVVEQGSPAALQASGGAFSALFSERQAAASWRIER